MSISTIRKTSYPHSRHLQWECYKSRHPALNWPVKLKKKIAGQIRNATSHILRHPVMSRSLYSFIPTFFKVQKTQGRKILLVCNVYMDIIAVCSNMNTKHRWNLEVVDDTSSDTCGRDCAFIFLLYFLRVIGNKDNSKDGVTS
jgi:hypothetical protein